jgi:hypothetical protein
LLVVVVAASVVAVRVDTGTLLSVKQLVVAVLLKANFHLSQVHIR